MASSALGAFLPDALGYMAEAAVEEGETITLTSELLIEILRLVHPDMHPPNGANSPPGRPSNCWRCSRVCSPRRSPNRTGLARQCVTVLSTQIRGVPRRRHSRATHVSIARRPCRSIIAPPAALSLKQGNEEERQREAAKQRQWYEQRKARRAKWMRPKPCAACGNDIKGKRKDARFCSPVCRQRAHRSVTDKNNTHGDFERAVTLADAAE